MGDDSFTEVTTQSWGERLKNSIGGIVGGVVLFLASFVLLFWNEGNSVRNIRALNEMGKAAVTVSSDKVDAANEGMLVHMSGSATTKDVLSDPMFKLGMPAIKLVRSVEMYQWKENVKTEEKEKVGGSKETVKTYSYDTSWSSSEIDSSSFKKKAGHQNPKMAIKSKDYMAKNVSLGAFTLNAGQIGSISGSEEIELNAEMVKNLQPVLQGKTKVEGNLFYIGADSSNPQVGDYRISFTVVKPGKEISLIAVQKGKTFTPFIAKNGKEKQLTQMGNLTKEQMITTALKNNQFMTWLLRLVGFLMMFGGLQLVFKPLSVLGAVLPILGDIIEIGTGIVAFLISVALSMLTIAIAWIFFRPLIGILLLLVAAGAIAALVFLKIKKGKKPAQAAA